MDHIYIFSFADAKQLSSVFEWFIVCSGIQTLLAVLLCFLCELLKIILRSEPFSYKLKLLN